MTVKVNDRRHEHPGDGIATGFNGPMAYRSTDIVVNLVDEATNVAVQQPTSAYTLTGIGNTRGTRVLMNVAPPIGQTLQILRDVPFSQDVNITNQGAFNAEALEQADDLSIMQIQQLADRSERSLQFSETLLLDGFDPILDDAPMPHWLLGVRPDGLGFGLLEPPAIATVADGAIVDESVSDIAGIQSNKLSFLQSGVDAFLRSVEQKLRELPTVLDFIDPSRHAGIAAGTDTDDVSDAFNAALAAHKEVGVPPGHYYLMDEALIPLGKRLVGYGRRTTVIHVNDSFNMAALGVIRLEGNGDAGECRGMTIIFEQPDSSVAADYTQYPPAIYAVNAPRGKIVEMRIAMCWDGIDMTGNPGGLTIEDLELSMFNKGIIINGSLDTNRITDLHMWPFGSVGQGVMTNNQRLVNRAAYGVHSGRCDGLVMTNCLIFDVRKGVYCYRHAVGEYTIGNFSNMQFDGDGGLHIIDDGRIQLSSGYFTKDSADGNWLVQTGGVVEMASVRMVNSVIAISGNGCIDVSGGTLNLVGCRMERGSLDSTLVYASGTATVNITGGEAISVPNVSFTKPAIRYAGSANGAISGLHANTKTAGTGDLIQVDNDVGLTITGLRAGGWPLSLPSARAFTVVDTQERFAGCVSSTGTSNGLPFGWSCSRVGVGNYQVAHVLGLSAVRDVVFVPITEGVAFASWDVAASTTGAARIRTYDAAGAAVDVAFSFTATRRR